MSHDAISSMWDGSRKHYKNTYIVLSIKDALSTPGIAEMVENNVVKKKGSFIFKYIYGDPEIRDWEDEDSIIIPLNGRLKIITPRRTGKIRENRGSFLRLPEASLRKIASDAHESGFNIRSLSMTGMGGDIFHASLSSDGIISFETFWNLLDSGFSFQNGIFVRDDVYLGIDSTSRLWSNSRELISSFGDNLAGYIQSSIAGMERMIPQNQRDDRIFGKERMMKYSVSPDSFNEIIRRIGRNRINLMKRENGQKRTVYSTSMSGDLFIMFHTGENLTFMPIGPVSLNGLIEYVEIIEKAGGVFLG